MVRDNYSNCFSILISLCFVVGVTFFVLEGIFRLEGHYFCARGFSRFLVAKVITFLRFFSFLNCSVSSETSVECRISWKEGFSIEWLNISSP